VSAVFLGQPDGFAGAFSQVVKLGAFCLAASQGPDIDYARAMQRENTLDTFIVNDSTHGEHFVYAAAFAGDDYAGEYLDSLFIALFYFTVYIDRVADLEVRQVGFQALAFDGIQQFSFQVYCSCIVTGKIQSPAV
jgi:hypothetical protein